MPVAQPPSTRVRPASRWHFIAAVATWLLPGLGHLLLGQRARGWIIGVTILCLWGGGLALGGVSVIDWSRQRAWFLGQMLIAPSIAVAWQHDRLKARYLLTRGPQPAREGEPEPAFEPAYGRMAEMGTLYTALAGMLNLLAMIDVIYRDPRPKDKSKPQLAGEPA